MSSEVTSAAAVAQLLARLLDNRCQLGALTGSGPLCSTILLEIDFLGGTMLLDGLYPETGNFGLGPGSRLRIQGRLEGSSVDFHCTIAEIVGDEGALAYRVDLPSSVLYHERRGSFRLVIPPELKLAPSMFSGGHGPLQGRLLDISRDGAATLIHDAAARRGAELTCSFTLPDSRLQATAEVCSAQNAGDDLRVGLVFRGLSSIQRTSLDHAIASLERALLRHHVTARWM